MRSQLLGSRRRIVVAIVLTTLIATGSASASDFKVLHRFKRNVDGQHPGSTPTLDAAGNVYGTTTGDGGQDLGSVFELTPNEEGRWTRITIHKFSDYALGGYPLGRLVFDTSGNLYGTTVNGGAESCGTVFELSPNPDGSWTHKVLYSFHGDPDGQAPTAGLIFDSAGNLYGTTAEGGGRDFGTVFKMTPNPDGSWTESVLFRFIKKVHGFDPRGELVFDALGSVYGTTTGGGAFDCLGHRYGCGGVFKLSPTPDGTWTEDVIHRFKGHDGRTPWSALTFDAAGNLYGTTSEGGSPRCSGNGCGEVFRMSPNRDGSWEFTKIHTFSGHDGQGPGASVIFDAAGNLYGTTVVGGTDNSGTVFRLTPNPDGTWQESVLKNFQYAQPDGVLPVGVTLDAAGNLYGTTVSGGKGNSGVVFEITP